MSKATQPVTWITKGSKSTMPSRERGPYLNTVWRELLMPSLVSQKFMICCMMCLHSFSFSVMADREYFIVWSIVEFKAFHALFCWMPPNLTEVSHGIAFLCMYLTWYLLLPSVARYITKMSIASFELRYWCGTFYLVLLVSSKILFCPGFVHFNLPPIHS